MADSLNFTFSPSWCEHYQLWSAIMVMCTPNVMCSVYKRSPIANNWANANLCSEAQGPGECYCTDILQELVADVILVQQSVAPHTGTRWCVCNRKVI